MTKFGIICPPGIGHLNNFMALGYELQTRGHEVTLFGLPDVQSYATAAKINFFAIGENEFPVGSTKKTQEHLGELSGILALFYTIDLFRKGTKVVLDYIPPACRKLCIEVLLIDQVLLEGSTISEYLDLPFITVCSAILLNPEPTVPPTLTGWNYDPSWLGQLRNQVSSKLLELAGTPIKSIVNQYRQKWGLDYFKADDKLELWSKKAIISQQPPLFEFPRQELPDYFYFTGPMVNSISRAEIPFPWEQLNGKPLIYASLGTLQNKLLWVFIQIAYACLELDVQLVISLGGATEPEKLAA